MSPFLTTLGGGSVRGFGRAFRRITAAFVAPPGQQLYDTPGTYTFTVPTGVTSISVCTIGGGGGSGFYSGPFSNSYPWGAGGGGGALAYTNNIVVTPGTNITVVVGAGGAGISKTSATQQVTSANSTLLNRGGDSYITLPGGDIPVWAEGGNAPGSVSPEYGGGYPEDEGGGTNYAFTGGGGKVKAGTGGNGGSGGGATYKNNYAVSGGGGGAGGYSGNGGDGGQGAFASFFLSNTGWTAGTAGIGGGGGGGAGGSWEQSLSVANRYPSPSTYQVCQNQGYTSNGTYLPGGGGGGVGIKGIGSNGAGGSSYGFSGQGGSGGSTGNSPPNFNISYGATYGGGAGGNDVDSYVFQPVEDCYYDPELQDFVCNTQCSFIRINNTNDIFSNPGIPGGRGAVRIIWGSGRSYPSNAADV